MLPPLPYGAEQKRHINNDRASYDDFLLNETKIMGKLTGAYCFLFNVSKNNRSIRFNSGSAAGMLALTQATEEANLTS